MGGFGKTYSSSKYFIWKFWYFVFLSSLLNHQMYSYNWLYLAIKKVRHIEKAWCHPLKLILPFNPGPPVRPEGESRSPAGRPAGPRRPGLLPIRPVPLRRPVQGQSSHPGDHQHAEGLAAGAPEEPLPHQGGEDHVGHHHQDDPDAGGPHHAAAHLWYERSILNDHPLT